MKFFTSSTDLASATIPSNLVRGFANPVSLHGLLVKKDEDQRNIDKELQREHVVVVVISFILDVRLHLSVYIIIYGRTNRGHTGGRPHRQEEFFFFSIFLLQCLP